MNGCWKSNGIATDYVAGTTLVAVPTLSEATRPHLSPALHRRRLKIGVAVACVVSVAAVIGLCFSGVSDETGRLTVAVSMFLLAGAATVSPYLATLAAAVLTQFAASYSEFSSPFIVLALLALSAVLAYRLPTWQAGIAAALLWYLAQTELAEGVWLPNNALTAALLGVLLLAAGAAGWALKRSSLQRKMDAHRLQQQIEDERERAVLALHGSVASSLTSVVLRSEALAMSGDPRISEAAQLIASDARRSMQEVRDLIRFMRDDSPTAPQDSAPHVRLLDALTNLAADLRAHGFPVVETGLTENVLGTAQLEPAARVCRELATNILKYGDASRPVVIAALQGEDELTVAVQNTIASQQRDTHMSTGIGLEEAQQLAAAHGASLTWHAESGSWRYELAVPR